jgi:acetyltransferase-like isoleucine patch superfamily enzyme
MRGRDYFIRYSVFFSILTRIMAAIPCSIRQYIYRQTSGWEGNVGIGFRYCIVKALCKQVGECVNIGPHVVFKGWENLSIGDNVSIHTMCYIDAMGSITIGSDV